ncbi:hypothetical protein DSTSK_26330 [Desulforhabdus sp. TSK]|nr:hypothetical protein DSTSK_26330 [Desulforhabdus sp. TSK]
MYFMHLTTLCCYRENPPQSPFDKGGGMAFPQFDEEARFPPFIKGGQGGFY